MHPRFPSRGRNTNTSVNYRSYSCKTGARLVVNRNLVDDVFRASTCHVHSLPQTVLSSDSKQIFNFNSRLNALLFNKAFSSSSVH